MPLDRSADGSPFSSETPFDLRLLGPFELVARSTGTLVPVSAAKMRALLIYLAAAPRFTETRRRLAGLLWASSGEDQARQSLRQLLSNFRRGADPQRAGIIVFDESSVSLDAALLAIDRTALMEVRPDADVAELGRIADLYRNDFGFGLDIGEPEFDIWLHGERTRARDAAVAVHDRLVRALAGLGRHEEALARANRLAEIDPLREETHRLVIAEEALVSGRASAMMRYESFRLLLRDDLGVRPEPATRRLLEELRQPAGDHAPLTDANAAVPEVSRATIAAAPPGPRSRRAFWPLSWRPALAAAMALLMLGGVIATYTSSRFGAPASYVGEDAGRVSVVLLPFETAGNDDALRGRARAYEAETRLSFARNSRLAMVEVPDTVKLRDPLSVGRALRARYVIRTSLTETASGVQADVSLFDAATGVGVATTPVPMTDQKIKFARELFRFIYPEITLHRARTLSAADPDSIPALLWRAEAARIKTRVGAADPQEFALFEAVLARDPDQLHALLGLSDCLILKVAREQSQNRAEDVGRATALLVRAREQAPNLAEVAFSEGMLNKLQGKFEQAGLDFERTFQLDRTHWNAAAQAAHVKIFLGRFEEAYRQMESVTGYLLPDIAAAETAYIAGETALVAGHADRAVAYLDMAIQGNAMVPRIHGLHAAALWLAGREAEARAAAALSQSLTPPYKADLMARRGGVNASPRYRAARDQYVAAFRAALAAPSTD